jgi:hypothetical protein
MIYVKGILVGVAAVAISNTLVLGIPFLIVMGMGGFWGFDFSLAGLATPAGAPPTSFLIFAVGFYWQF